MTSNRCTVPGCYRVKWSTAGVCHTHAGAQEQWLSNIASSGTVMTSIESKKKKAPSTPSGVAANPKLPVQNNSGSAFPSHLQLGQLGLGPARLPWMAGVNPQMGHALSSGQSTLLPALYHQLLAENAANRLQESLYPDQASYLSGRPVCVAMLPPHMMVPSPSMGQGNRDTGSDGDLSVFKLTPSHNKGRTARPGDGGSTESRGGQDSRSWHTPRAEVSSGEALLHPVPVVMQQVTTGSEQRDSSVEDSSHTWQSTRPKAAHSQPSISEHLQEANSVVQSSAQNVEAQLGNRSRDREEDVFIVDDEDVFVVDDEDVVFVGVDLSLSRTESNNKNFNSSKSELLSASNQQALPLTTAETKNDESDDDCIILDLSLGLSSEQEDSEQGNSSMHTVEKYGFLGEGINQGERAVCEQASLSAVSSGQDCESATQDTENVEPSEIMVLETVSLSEQQNTYLDQDATPKSYRQLSAESYYRCGCSKGCCGFRTVLPSQLELHLQEEHPYDVIYPCVHCGSREAGINSLICHLEQHLAPQNLSLHCSDMFCHFMSSLPEEVLSHIHLSHPNQASHFCWLCTTKFDNLTMFFSHVQENLLRVFKCQLCSARDVDRQGILNHMASSHPDQGHLIAVQKIFICQERKVHYWDAAEGNAEGLTVAKQGGAPMPGSSDEDVASTRSEQTGISSSMTSRKTSESLPQQGKSAPHELSPSPEAQEKERSCIKTQKQKLETRKKEVTIHSPSKNELLIRLLVDGSINTSPSDVTAKLTGTNTTPAADKTKLPNTDTSLTADQSQPPDLSTVHAAVEAVLATEKAGSSKKQSGLHSASQRELPSKSSQQLTKMDSGSSDTIVDVVGTNDAEWSIESPQQRTRMNSGSSGCSLDVTYTNDTEWSSKSSQERARTELGSSGSTLDVTYTNDTEWSSKSPQQRARTESGSSDSTIDIMYTKENSAGTETQGKGSAVHTPIPGRASEEEANGMEIKPETEFYSWIDYTYRLLEREKFGCSFCDHESRFIQSHVKHIHSSHTSHFKGFACQRCSFISIDQDARREHRCDGNHHLRARSRITYSEDVDATDLPPANVESHVKTRLKRKISEGPSPSSKKTRTSEEIHSLPSPSKDARGPETGASVSSLSDKTRGSGTGCTLPMERRLRGVLLMCNICGLTGPSRSGMQLHMYSQHADMMACPVCSDTLGNDRQLQKHLSDMHPDMCSAFQRMKSQNFITQVSSAGGEEDVSSRKESVSEEMGGSGWPGNEAVEDKPLVNGDLQDEGDQQNQNHTTCTSSPLKTFKTELLACKFCGFSSRNVMLVKSHLYDKHPEVAKCPKCEVKLAGDRKLYRHLGEAHPGETESLYQQHRSLSWIVKPDDTSEQLSCKLCGYSCTQSDAAYNHMYTEHKDVMKCPNCRVELGSDQELYQHLSDDHNDERDVLYSQHCSVSWFETIKKNREWAASRITGRPTMLRIKKRPPAKKNSTRHRLSETGCETVASMPSSSAAGMPALHQSSDLADRIPLILTGELTSEVSVSFSNGCSEMSMSVPLMTAEQYDALAAEEVIDNKEFRCPHCTSDFKWRYKFYEHLCYHYHYRCFRCAHCSFLAFSGSSVVNHNKKAHNVDPIVEHLPKANLERRIERAISQSLAVVTQPHTERRLLAYERARLKKQNKCRQAPNKKLVKKPKSPLKPRKVLTSKSEEVLSENMSENNKKSPKRSRPKKVVTCQSNIDSEGRGTWLRCPYCRGPKKTQEAVENEIRYHIHYKPYICSYCKHASGSENCIKRHLAATHPQENAVIGYERIEQKEKRFVTLMKKAFELSETTAKTHLMSSVKKKYKKVVGSGNKAGMSGGQIEATRSPGKVTRSHGKVVTTNPGKEVTRSPGKVVTRSPGKVVTTNPGKEVTRSPGKVVTRSPGKVVTTNPGKEVTRSPGKVVTRSPGKVVTRSPGKVVTRSPGKVVTRSPGKVVTRSPVKVVTRCPEKDMKNSADQQTGPGLYIQCAHCNFSGKTREAVMGHIIEHHQNLLHLNCAVAAPSTLTDSSSQQPSSKCAD